MIGHHRDVLCFFQGEDLLQALERKEVIWCGLALIGHVKFNLMRTRNDGLRS